MNVNFTKNGEYNYSKRIGIEVRMKLVGGLVLKEYKSDKTSTSQIEKSIEYIY